MQKRKHYNNAMQKTLSLSSAETTDKPKCTPISATAMFTQFPWKEIITKQTNSAIGRLITQWLKAAAGVSKDDMNTIYMLIILYTKMSNLKSVQETNTVLNTTNRTTRCSYVHKMPAALKHKAHHHHHNSCN